MELGLAQVTGPLRVLCGPICPALCLVVQQQGQSRDTLGGVRKEAASGTQKEPLNSGEPAMVRRALGSQKVTYSDGLEVLVSGEESGHR